MSRILGPDGQPARPIEPTGIERFIDGACATWVRDYMARQRAIWADERVRALRESLGAPTYQTTATDVVRAKLPARYRRREEPHAPTAPSRATNLLTQHEIGEKSRR